MLCQPVFVSTRRNGMREGGGRAETTYASGRITAQSQPAMRQPTGTASVVRMIIAAQHAKLMTSAIQNRLRILGTSCQKFDRSTSFFVAPHVMLYENRWASRAWERWILSPPKKKKLSGMSAITPCRE